MKNNFFLLLTIYLMGFSACENKKGDPFGIEGTIKGAENKMISIETMTFPNINQNAKFVLIDTVRADANGSFVIEDYLPERMICRISVENNAYNYYIISLYNEKIEINADINKQMKPEITGSPATHALYSFIDEVRKNNEAIQGINDSILNYKSAGNDSLANIFLQKREDAEKSYYTTIKTFADTTKEVSNAIIAIEGLLFDEEFDYIKNYAARAKNSSDSSSVYVKELIGKVTLQENIMAESFTGKPFTDIMQPNPDGNQLKLSDLKGNIVLVDFWASWCVPCRKENPNVVKVYNTYKDKGFKIYSVSLDTKKNDWVTAIQKDGLIWDTHVAVLDDRNNKAAIDYKVTGIPMSFLIDRNGIIVAENLRGAELEKKVKELVEQ